MFCWRSDDIASADQVVNEVPDADWCPPREVDAGILCDIEVLDALNEPKSGFLCDVVSAQSESS